MYTKPHGTLCHSSYMLWVLVDTGGQVWRSSVSAHQSRVLSCSSRFSCSTVCNDAETEAAIARPQSRAICSRWSRTAAATRSGSVMPSPPPLSWRGCGELERRSSKKRPASCERPGASKRGSHSSSLARSHSAEAACDVSTASAISSS